MTAGHTERSPQRLGRYVGVVTLAAAIFALVVAATGGFDLRLAGLRLRATAWERPAIVALAGLAWLSYVARPRVTALWVRAWASAGRAADPRLLVAAAAAWTLAAGLFFGTFACGGADSYGYVGQARLLLEGRVTDTVPLRPGFSWRDAGATLVPLGFTLGRAPGVIAPKYPPGLPLLMAPLAATSERAIYLLVPLCGVLAVWLIYRLGVEIGDPLAGGIAAMLLSASPTFLYQLVQPMSDVPGAACWLGALALASRRTPLAAGAAGIVSALAIAIRPNLAPLAVVIAGVTVCGGGTSRWRHGAIFAAGLLPGIVALGWVQSVRYGSALSSGYGTIEDGFGAANILPNLSRYPRWVTATHTPFIWLSVLAPVWIGRNCTRPPVAWTAVLLSAAIWAAYMPYVPFGPDEWFYTRFLLPAIACMLLFATAVALSGVRRLPPAFRGFVACVIVLTLLGTSLASRRAGTAFDLHLQESKYPAAGEFVRARLPGAAFILAGQHSGSLRYYAHRPTLRWDVLGQGDLDDALAGLRAEGFEPFAVLDADEDAAFRVKFAGQVAKLVPLASLGATRIFGFSR